MCRSRRNTIWPCVEMHRPPHNSFDHELVKNLAEALEATCAVMLSHLIRPPLSRDLGSSNLNCCQQGNPLIEEGNVGESALMHDLKGIAVRVQHIGCVISTIVFKARSR